MLQSAAVYSVDGSLRYIQQGTDVFPGAVVQITVPKNHSLFLIRKLINGFADFKLQLYEFLKFPVDLVLRLVNHLQGVYKRRLGWMVRIVARFEAFAGEPG